MSVRIHPTAEVSPNASIGEGTSIWHHAQIREGVSIGQDCILGKGVYVDAGVQIGNNVKIQNYVSVFHGVEIEDGVFIGPHVCFTNDMFPRAINPDGSLKSADDWTLTTTLIQTGASLGANSTLVCGVKIGPWAMVGAGSVVTHDVPAHGLAWGNPACLHGFVCACGGRFGSFEQDGQTVRAACPACGRTLEISIDAWRMLK